MPYYDNGHKLGYRLTSTFHGITFEHGFQGKQLHGLHNVERMADKRPTHEVIDSINERIH